VQQNVLKSGN